MIIKTKSFHDLTDYSKAWVKGTFRNLYLVGYPGSGKTFAITEALKDHPRHVVWDGHVTPKRLYQLLKEWNNRGITMVVLDDVHGVYSNDDIAGLLKQAMDKGTVSWGSTQNLTGEETIELSMRFCIITNQLTIRNNHVRALMSRSLTLEHVPPAELTLKHALDNHIIDQPMFERISFIGWPSNGMLDMRWLKQLAEIKKMKKNWEEVYKDNLRQV